MKKILFATTALIATASVAAADVSFGGYGRFGAAYTSVGGVTSITSRFRLQIDATTEADNGLTFGARVRLETDSNAANQGAANGFSAPLFTVGASGLTVGVGNINGAIESTNGLYAQSLGLTGLGFHNNVANSSTNSWGWDSFSSKGATARNGVSVSYSAGDFGVNASYSKTGGTTRSAIGASYTFSGWTVALAYQDSNVNAEDKTILTVAGKVGIAGLNFAVANNNGNTKYGIGADFEVGAATTVSAFANTENAGQAYGLGVKHDLGGGASVRGGVVRTAAGTTLADLGLHFNF